MWEIAGLVVVGLGLLVLILWAIPSLLTRAPAVGGPDRHKAQADVRTALIATLVACAGLGTLFYTARSFRLNSVGHLSQRFQEAAKSLGADNATVRVAGVQALGQLADQWSQQRQGCISVICAFLRAVDEKGEPLASPYERRAALDVLRRGLLGDQRNSWAACDFDLSGAVLDSGDLRDVQFDAPGHVSFAHACFRGPVTFSGAVFAGADVSFRDARFDSRVDFSGARFTRGTVCFDRVVCDGGAMAFDRAEFGDECVVTFAGARLGPGVSFVGATLHGSSASPGRGVSFAHARFEGSPGVDGFPGAPEPSGFDGATFHGRVSFADACVERKVSSQGAVLTGVTLDLARVRLGAGQLYFGGARTLGATLDVTRRESTGGQIFVTWLEGPPAVVGDVEPDGSERRIVTVVPARVAPSTADDPAASMGTRARPAPQGSRDGDRPVQDPHA